VLTTCHPPTIGGKTTALAALAAQSIELSIGVTGAVQVEAAAANPIRMNMRPPYRRMLTASLCQMRSTLSNLPDGGLLNKIAAPRKVRGSHEGLRRPIVVVLLMF